MNGRHHWFRASSPTAGVTSRSGRHLRQRASPPAAGVTSGCGRHLRLRASPPGTVVTSDSGRHLRLADSHSQSYSRFTVLHSLSGFINQSPRGVLHSLSSFINQSPQRRVAFAFKLYLSKCFVVCFCRFQAIFSKSTAACCIRFHTSLIKIPRGVLLRLQATL